MKERWERTEELGEWLISRIDHSTQSPDIGFVETLYQACSRALVYLWKTKFRFMLQGPHKSTLKKDVANIRLWEENFPSGSLDITHGKSRHLKMNVVENLKEIGNILRPYLASSDTSTATAEKQSKSARDFADELETQLEKAAIMLSAGYSSESSSEDEESDDSSSPVQREHDRYGRLHCYVKCLMDLAPVIEKHFCHSQKESESQSTPVDTFVGLSHSAQPFAMHIRDRSVSPKFPSAKLMTKTDLQEHTLFL
jgi:hypothetical protein